MTRSPCDADGPIARVAQLERELDAARLAAGVAPWLAIAPDHDLSTLKAASFEFRVPERTLLDWTKRYALGVYRAGCWVVSRPRLRVFLAYRGRPSPG